MPAIVLYSFKRPRAVKSVKSELLLLAATMMVNSGPIELAHDKIKILRDPWFSLCLALISKDGIKIFFLKTSIWLLIDRVSGKLGRIVLYCVYRLLFECFSYQSISL